MGFKSERFIIRQKLLIETFRMQDQSQNGLMNFWIICGCKKGYKTKGAFNNHCKKCHAGEVPEGTTFNNQYRPDRISQNQQASNFEAEFTKSENSLLLFLGELRTSEELKKSGKKLIEYIQDPEDRLPTAVENSRKWIKEDKENHGKKYCQSLLKINEILITHELPEFYDPTEPQMQNKVDSYNFLSIMQFILKHKSEIEGEYIVNSEILLLCWLSRYLAIDLLSEIVYLLLQRHLKQQIHEPKFFISKSTQFFMLLNAHIAVIERGKMNMK